MDNIKDISKYVFEPCHIEEVPSPFFAREHRSLSHTDRFSNCLSQNKQEGSLPTDEKEKFI